MRDFTAETREVINIFLTDPTPNVEVVVRNQILRLAKTSPGDLFGLHADLANEWGRAPLRWSGEDICRARVLEMIAKTIGNEHLCHMCQMGHFAHVNTVGEGQMAVRHYKCINPACGCYDAEPVYPI